MSIMPLVYEPAQVLREPTKAVTIFDEKLNILIDDMFETMYANQGCGLAAPQVGVSLSLSVIDMKGTGEEKLVIINPEIIEKKDEHGLEAGCLSVPGVVAIVKRAAKVKVRAQNRHGDFFEIEGDNLFAECLQHEIDHLNGILFVDRLSSVKKKLLLEKSKKIRKRLKKLK